MRKIIFTALVAALTFPGAADAATVMYPTVAELFTSQSCSSCPPADDLMREKAAADPGLLVLSYHVNYWDHTGWKDMFSSQGSTDRQRGYYTALHENMFYTPELVVNGMISMIGSDENKASLALASYKIDPPLYNIEIEPLLGKQKPLWVLVNSTTGASTRFPVDVWAITYISYARTRIAGGENEGRTVENINNVTSITKLGQLAGNSARYQLPDFGKRKDLVAVIVQQNNQGPILAAATYQP
jgi:hypothetical protein